MNRILIVDDEQLIRLSLAKDVEKFDDTTVVSGFAANGAQALEWLESNYADMCITDVRMPIMDGLELIRQINARYPWMKAVVISSYDDFQYARESIQLGALDYILKPIDPKLLGDALSASIQRMHKERAHKAAQLLLQKLPHHKAMLDQWIELVTTIQFDKLPLLVVDTLEMLEEWVKGVYYLLIPLSMAWLHLIVEELKKEKLEIILHEGKDLGLGEKTIPNDKLRAYYRLCAVRRLEEGAIRLFEVSKGSKENNPHKKVIDEVKQFLWNHYAEKFSLQEIGEHVGMSRSYMANVFKQQMGTTIWDYLVAIRMQKAREILLKDHQLKIYEIASHVGYDNTVHFSQLFKNFYGLSPMEYKKRMEA